MERRVFLETAAGICATLALGGCAAVAVTPVTAVGGAVRLPLRNYPQLAAPGGYLRIQPAGGTTPVYVLAGADQEYVALSPICTHLGCTVNVEGSLLVCPCHGSTYDAEGRVLRGPAERPLRRYPAAVEEGELIIQLEGGA